MKCPNCNNEYTRVKETRVIDENPQWSKRRRICPNCEHQFWTVEMPAEDVVIGGDYE
jgi:transcriptional regulator NrdR family protein